MVMPPDEAETDGVGAAGQVRRGRPRGSTRERILDIALALFNERGYDKTSLREIADRLQLSVRTVEGHMYRAAGRVGARDRNELARVIGEAFAVSA